MANIKLSNSVLVDSTALNNGINTSNKIASSTSTSYSATQDCWARCWFSSNDNVIAINNQEMFYCEYKSGSVIFLKKGQTWKVVRGTLGGLTIWGVK